MAKLNFQRAFDEFLKDPNISLRAKRFLTKVLTNNITTKFEVKNIVLIQKKILKMLYWN